MSINGKPDIRTKGDAALQERLTALERENEMLKSELRRLQPQTVTISAEEYRRLRYKAGFYDRIHDKNGRLNSEILKIEKGDAYE